MMLCARPDCGNELNKGKLYCSSRCAAIDRKRLRLQAEEVLTVPAAIATSLSDALGENGRMVVDEINIALQDSSLAIIPFPKEGITYGEWTLSFDGRKDYRPGSRLSYEIIDDMLRSGPVVFAMEMKRAQVHKVFSEGRFKVESPDKELAEVADAALRLIMPKMANDFTYSAFAYGVSFQEEVWVNRTKYELGMSASRNAQSSFTVPRVPNSVKPSTVDHIRRTEDKSFNGYVQRKDANMALSDIDGIIVERDAALVIPYNERFRNLWGESFLKALYPIWLWYEITLRTMARYMERMAMPVVVAKAPSRSSVLIEGQTRPVRAMDLALALAGNVAKSNAVAIPSDRDEQGNALWELSYLTADEKGAAFIQVLEFLQQEMIRAGLSADRSLSQGSGGVGSYNIGELHAQASSLTSEMILQQFVYYLNEHFMPSFSLYNRGKNGPPIWLKTQAIDLAERQLLMQILGVAGNTPAGQEFFWQIDWETLGEISNIPLLSEAEMDARKAKIQQEQMDKMEQQQEIMAKNQGPIPAGGASAFPNKDAKKNKDSQTAGGNTPPKPPPIKSEFEQAVENVFLHRIPWMLSEYEARILLERGVVDEETIKLFLPGEFDEAKVKRDAGGKFAKKSGGDKAVGFPSLDPEQQARLNELKASLAAKLAEGSDTPYTAQELDRIAGLIGSEMKFETLEEAVAFWNSTFEEMGIGGVDIKSVRTFPDGGIIPDHESLGAVPGLGGLYEPNTNEFFINEKYAQAIKDGDILANWVVAHEMLHSRQEANRGLVQGEFHPQYQNGVTVPDAIADTTDPTEIGNWHDLSEGQNDLVTMMALSKAFKTRVDYDTTKLYNYIKSGDGDSPIGYPTGATAWTTLLQEKRASDASYNPYTTILSAHDNGLDIPYTRRYLNDLAPSSNAATFIQDETDLIQASYERRGKEYSYPSALLTMHNDFAEFLDGYLAQPQELPQ